MSKPIPAVAKYMTASPHSIGQEQTLSAAHKIMHDHLCRHLPVLHGGALVGIVTDRDLHLIESLKDVDPGEVLVEDAMSSQVYSVSPEAPLDEVASEMAAKMQNGKVVGIFTTVDACQALADLLQTRLAK
jgi:acetoin utilization protein AcuB